MSVLYVGGERHVLVLNPSDRTNPILQKVDVGPVPSFLAFAPRKRRVLAVVEGGDRLTHLCIENDGTLTPLGDVPCAGGPAYVSVDRDETRVFTASYGSGEIRVFPLDERGALGPATGERFAGQWAHAALLDPTQRDLFVPCKGADSVARYRVTADGIEEIARTATASGFGPRHLAFAQTRRRAYLVAENSCELGVYDTTGGAFTLLQTSSTLPRPFQEGDSGADVHLAPDERFVYVSNRGHDSIAVFAVTDGGVTLVEHVSSGGRVPRNFSVHEDELVVANQESRTLVFFERDPASGRLRSTRTLDVGERAFWVGDERASRGA